MNLPDDSYTQLAPDLRMCRVLNGLWQVSGAHGAIDPRAAIPSMVAYHDAGFTTWDLADHYGPAEDFVGAFRRALAADRGEAALEQVQAFTKWVPPPERMTRQIVEENVAISRRRMGMDRLDLLQFHWWEYAHPGYLDALAYLSELRDAGQIRHVALTNFDTEHLGTIVERGIRIASNQVQYSLIDRRPEVQMAAYCQARRIQLLTYGTLCGGLLSERYLGQPEPDRSALTTASLRKYKPMIDAWGGWALFQELLRALEQIAARHGVSIANVAVRAILDRPAVGGVIVGTRLGLSEHIADTTRVFGLRLTPEDNGQIETVLARSRDLYQCIGDCGAEYRR
jgi:aryl-alcohol dehydrogenase-like predicted oxidoreductase